MDDVIRQMNTTEKPRDVSGVELLMNNHQSLKAEIDTREDNFTSCISLGKELLSRNHYASNEIKEKLLSLNNQRNALLHRWEERWENLQLILEVYQFARDAAVAEAWLLAQEPYLMSHELGHTIDDVENLIKKHESFEKSATAQEERFSALERLTTFELKDLKKREEEEERRKAEEAAARQAAQAAASKQQSVDRGDGAEGDTGQQNGASTSEPEPRKVDELKDDEPPKGVPVAQATYPPSPPKPQRVQPIQALKDKDTTLSPGRKVKRSRSKSPFRSFRWKKSGGSSGAKSSAVSDDEDNLAAAAKRPSPSADECLIEDTLSRKHVWEALKKASNRSWNEVYVVVRGHQLLAYKDAKSAKSSPDSYYKGEAPIDLSGASVDIATDYTKKKHVFRVKLSNGSEYLFQAKDDEDMRRWTSTLRPACEASGPGTKAQTLPAGQSSQQETKKRSFFTLKRT